MHNYKKDEKEIYGVKQKPTVLVLPKANYFTIKGVGHPGSEDFIKRIGALYQLSYGVRMIYKDENIKTNFTPYTVYPLEGFWDLTEKGRKLNYLDKNELVYELMIKQPQFLDKKLFEYIFNKTKKKTNNSLLDEIEFKEVDEGLVIQMLHIGSFDKENETFDIMKEYIKNNNHEIKTLRHKEIYLSDFRKTSEDKLKTILRYQLDK